MSDPAKPKREPAAVPASPPEGQERRHLRVSDIDAMLPAQIAEKAEAVGVAKAAMGTFPTFVLAVLAGAYIAMGAVFATTVGAGMTGVVPYGIARLLVGLVFCLGLILVVLAGAELFTGNVLIVLAFMGRRIGLASLLRNWGLVYAGNLVGALGTAVLIVLAGQYTFGGGAVGLTALSVAHAKTTLGFLPALLLGVLCNALVCLAVWLTMGARSATDKVLVILFPISAFVAAGFEHSVANMYFVPVGLLIKADAAFLAQMGRSVGDYAALTWSAFLLENLLPVTLGNIVGGGVLVAVVYWSIYLRRS